MMATATEKSKQGAFERNTLFFREYVPLSLKEAGKMFGVECTTVWLRGVDFEES